MANGNFVSPDEMFEAAKEDMLRGEEPESHADWVLIMNYFAHNIAPATAPAACRVLRALYDMPLDVEEVDAIVAYQLQAEKA